MIQITYAGPRAAIEKEDTFAADALISLLDHRGGKRMDEGGWEYNLLLRWIKAGTPSVKEKDATFASLEVEPKEIVFSKPADVAKLRVIARWTDDTREDVTPLCRFRSNDDALLNPSRSTLNSDSNEPRSHLAC